MFALNLVVEYGRSIPISGAILNAYIELSKSKLGAAPIKARRC